MSRIVSFLLLCLLLVGSVSAEWCYQESANVSTGCGGLGNGSYALGGGGTFSLSGYAFDGNWSSYGYCSTGTCYFYMNYSVPSNTSTISWSKDASLWQIGNYNSTSGNVLSSNVSLAPCSISTGKLQFRVLSNNTGLTHLVNWTCNNGSVWTQLNFTNYTFSTPYVYEEALWWNWSLNISLNVSIFDVTGSPVLANVSISLLGGDYLQVGSTTTGGYLSGALLPGVYVLRLENANYTTGAYVVSMTDDDMSLSAYLLNATDVVAFEFVDSTASSVTLPGVLVTQQRFINGSWTTVNMRYSDVTGRVTFDYEDEVAYRFIAVLDDYVSKTFNLDPVSYPSYQIRLARDTLLDFNQDFQTVSITYTPKVFFKGNNTLNITFNSPIGILANYSYLLRYPGGTNTSSGSSATGETFSVPFTITGAVAGSLVNITLFYTAAQGGLHQFSYAHEIIVDPGNTTFIGNMQNTYGMGLLDRVIIGTFIIVFVAGLATIGAGSIIGAGVGLFLMALFLFMGFWPWWAAGLSFLVGFALLAKRAV